MTNANEDPFIRVRDAGAYLGIPVRTLYDLRQRGERYSERYSGGKGLVGIGWHRVKRQTQPVRASC